MNNYTITKRHYIFFILSIITINLQGQIFSGTIYNETEPLAWVNIGIKGKNTGTVSDKDGKFTLNISKALPEDSLQISILGYESITYQIKDIPYNYGDSVIMKSKNYTLPEVCIYNFKKHKEKGIKHASSHLITGFNNSEAGAEIASLIPIKKRKTRLNYVKIPIAWVRTDSVKFRINIYEYKNGLPEKKISNQPIYFNVTKADKFSTITIDLSSYALILEDDFILSIESIEKTEISSKVDFYCRLFKNKYFSRNTSQDIWEEPPVSLSIGFIAGISY